jgi:aspartyl-tRNA(Asn)/glutamyl-tRNA(Gln) amidotransferase subunit A
MSEQIVKALKELHRIQPVTNACITIIDDVSTSNHVGPLSDWVIAAKDNFATDGILTTAGSKILSNYIGVYDATAIKKIKEACGVIVAKTALDELGMGGTGLTCFTGPVFNPYNQNHQAGGSSSGSAVVVAAGAVRMALGSDTGDSVRKPASFCGIVGVKPTYGRISRYGVIPYASSLDHVGYFTQNVLDAAVTLEVLSGFDPLDPTTIIEPLLPFAQSLTGDLKGKKIGVLKNVIEHIDHVETCDLFNDLVSKLEDSGAEVIEVMINEQLLKTALPTYYIIANCEATANHANLTTVNFGLRQPGLDLKEIMNASRTGGFNSLLRKRFVIGSYGLKDENQEFIFKKAQKVRRLLVQELNQALENVDALIAPASSTIAPKIGEDNIDKLSNKHLISENYMVLGNFSGYPSITVPMGYIHEMPIGVNITTKANTEPLMFDVALAIEMLTGLKNQVKKVIV